MDVLNLLYCKENTEKIIDQIGMGYFDYFKQLFLKYHNKLDKVLVTFKWSNVKIFLKLSCLFYKAEFLTGFLFNHICKEEQVTISSFECNILDSKVVALKYTSKGDMLNKATLTRNKKTNSFYIKSKFYGRQNYIPYKTSLLVNQPTRRIREGVIFWEYLFDQPEEERIGILIHFYDWLFKKYKTKDKNKISGVLLDCHFFNFLKTKRGYYYFDREFISTESLDKSYVLFWSLYAAGLWVWYIYFLKYYNIEDKSEYYRKNPPTPLSEIMKKRLSKIAREYKSYLKQNK